MKYTLAILAAAAVITGCAKRPDAIAPVDIPMDVYKPQSCQALRTELSKEQAVLTAVSKAQNDAATGDVVGVFLIGVPTSSAFGGDQEGKVAVQKGKVLAIENALKAKRC